MCRIAGTTNTKERDNYEMKIFEKSIKGILNMERNENTISDVDMTKYTQPSRSGIRAIVTGVSV